MNKWSYLSERKQFTSYPDVGKTSMCSIICGALQVSTLGPLLFLTYVNDLHKVSSILKPFMFADNTNLFLSMKQLSTIPTI